MAASEVGLTRVDTPKSKKRINSGTGGSAECSEVEADMSIQALVEGAASGALKGVKTGEGLKGVRPKITGEMDVGRIIAKVITGLSLCS